MDLELQDVFITFFRWFFGVLIGAGLALGWVLVSAKNRKLLSSSLFIYSFFRALPILGMSVLFARISISEMSKILLISWACFFPVVIATARGIMKEKDDLYRRISLLPSSTKVVYRHYLIPQAFVHFLSGVEISLGIGWLTVMAAEIIGTQNRGWNRGGLGELVYISIENGAWGVGIFGLVIFGLLGVASAWLWRRFSKYLWKVLFKSELPS